MPVSGRSVVDLPKSVYRDIFAEYALPLNGYHGPNHWGRVRDIGIRLASETGADPVVVELFALFHDSRRVNENHDPAHGLRGGMLALELLRPLNIITEDQQRLLFDACRDHTFGMTEADDTIMTCWDADRLDLLRVGITPSPRYLCTDAAKDAATIRWANQRALQDFRPGIVDDWTKCLEDSN